MRALLLLCTVLLLAAAPAAAPRAQDYEIPDQEGLYAVLVTDVGVMVLRLHPEQAPLTVANFVGLAEGTRRFTDPLTGEPARRPFYDGTTFHRVIPGFMIQGGDPTGTGQGGPGYRFRDEVDTGLRHDRAGTLSMANSGPGTNGSQFFITVAPTPWLDGRHAVFGHLVDGMDVLDAISTAPSEDGEPENPVTLREVRIVRVGEKAEAFDAEAVFHALVDLTQQEWEARRARDFAERSERLLRRAQDGPAGSRWTVLEAGEGPLPRPGQTLRVNYECYAPDGRVVESTLRRGRTDAAVAGQETPGQPWAPLYQEMRPGERIWVEIPGARVFGGRGIPGLLAPGEDLIAEVELVGIVGDVEP